VCLDTGARGGQTGLGFSAQLVLSDPLLRLQAGDFAFDRAEQPPAFRELAVDLGAASTENCTACCSFPSKSRRVTNTGPDHASPVSFTRTPTRPPSRGCTVTKRSACACRSA